MTKTRVQGSFEGAVLDCIRILGATNAARIAGISPKTLRDYSDAARPGRVLMETGAKLDRAMHGTVGRLPFLAAYLHHVGSPAVTDAVARLVCNTPDKESPDVQG